jgi:hypothetical protein
VRVFCRLPQTPLARYSNDRIATIIAAQAGRAFDLLEPALGSYAVARA